jgi:hypothetical protein
VAPAEFSIEQNPEGTTEFFNKILSKRDEHKVGTKFYIDVSEVITVDIAALMYLIAIINDAKHNSLFHYVFRGNFPKSESAKKFFVDSGFMTFVRANSSPEIKPTNNKIRILMGRKVDSPLAGIICQFVQTKCNITRILTMPLFCILIELMGNTRQHAYKDVNVSNLANLWYIYAEEKIDSVKFVFLDTGLGIPTTVQKKFAEPLFTKESDFIKSALNGEYRTETKKKNRGQGLPQISEGFRSGLLHNIFVYSGKGCCTLKEYQQNDYIAYDLHNKMFGTLFCWEIGKKNEETK